TTGSAHLRLQLDGEGAVGLVHGLVPAIVGWVERLRETQHPGAVVGSRARALDPTYKPYSCSASSRVRRIAGAASTTSSPSATRRNARLIGSCTNTSGSPREINSARRRFSSIIGPSTKPRMSGAGSQSSLSAT